ncbi:hypothetical protein [Xylophilus sp. GOD-11R]|uniref:hypothetical protein n=1 Tax=Xylophilus sp. GOD-11R TaxID=3089814 RepID=UPI00298BCDAC|nr:hypothetical protein [Xylophilus sp. GOD-11R]WPB55469.1 hypothetical protein R9X41_15115 [Xylophilus sp. GOD-11R]
MSPRARRTALLALAATVIAVVAVLVRESMDRAERQRQSDWGRALFHGEESPSQPPVAGRLAGHPTSLPVAATRCVNCHAATAAANAVGTPVQGGALQRLTPRRGGPPSAYDAASLCRLLRDGIDPADVLIDQTMPRYQVDDAQCAALWAWLTRPITGS